MKVCIHPDDSAVKLDSEHTRLSALLEISEAIVSTLEPPGLFAAITTSLRRVLRHEFGQLYLYDPDVGQLRTRALHFPNGKGLVREGMLVPIEGTPAGWVFTNHQPMRMDRPDGHGAPNETVKRLLAEGVRSGCCVPLACRGHVLGVLSVGSRREAAFSERDEKFLYSVADQFAIAIESALVRRVCMGEIHLFHELIRPYEREIYRIAYSVVRNPSDAEDIAQETLLKAMTHIHQLRSLDRFGSWLLRVAINEARMRKRKYRRALHDSFDTVPDDDGRCSSLAERWPDHRPIPSEVLEQRELKRTLAGAVACLPKIYREVCLLHHIEGLPTASTAVLLGTTVSVVKTRAHRARARLRDQLPELSVTTPREVH